MMATSAPAEAWSPPCWQSCCARDQALAAKLTELANAPVQSRIDAEWRADLKADCRVAPERRQLTRLRSTVRCAKPSALNWVEVAGRRFRPALADDGAVQRAVDDVVGDDRRAGALDYA